MPPGSRTILVSPVTGTELATLLPDLARHSRHTLTDDPAAADLILLVGNFSLEPRLLLDHPLYRAYPDKCAVYNEEDSYLPLLPGIYASAQADASTRAGRVATFAYVSVYGFCTNPYVVPSEAEKRYLFSFQGGSSSLPRKRLFNLAFNDPAILVENTSAYRHWDFEDPSREGQQQRYARTVAASHFVLCPRGAGTGSIRFFEVMQAGVAPVLIADDYVLPPRVPWDTFLLRVAEKDLARLPEILAPHAGTSAERGRRAREAWLEYFAPEKAFDAVVDRCAAALRHGPPEERTFRRRQARLIVRTEGRRKLRAWARSAVLWTLKTLRLKLPYQTNR